MKIAIVGCPDVGKRRFASELRDAAHQDHLRIVSTSLSKIAIGEQADYRTELFLASARVMDSFEGFGDIHLNTLIDSNAYVSARLANMINMHSVSDETLRRWSLAATLIFNMTVDSFKADHIFYLPGNDGSSFYKDLEEGLVATLDTLSLEYTTVNDPLNFVTEAATILTQQQEKDDDSNEGSDFQESDGQDQ